MGTKRENLLKKIENLGQKITESQAEIAKCKAELADLDKTELYRAVAKNGLTVEKAIEIISKPVLTPNSTPISTATPKIENSKIKEAENENT